MQVKPPRQFKGITHVGSPEMPKRGLGAPAIGAQTLGGLNQAAGLPANPLNVGAAMQAPAGVPNPTAAMANPMPENRIASFENKDQETT